MEKDATSWFNMRFSWQFWGLRLFSPVRVTSNLLVSAPFSSTSTRFPDVPWALLFCVYLLEKVPQNKETSRGRGASEGLWFNGQTSRAFLWFIHRRSIWTVMYPLMQFSHQPIGGRKSLPSHFTKEKTGSGGRGVGGLGEVGEGIEKYKLAVTKQSFECKVQDKEYSQYYCNNCMMPGRYFISPTTVLYSWN